MVSEEENRKRRPRNTMIRYLHPILQGSAVTQTVLGGLTTYPLVANLLQCQKL